MLHNDFGECVIRRKQSCQGFRGFLISYLIRSGRDDMTWSQSCLTQHLQHRTPPHVVAYWSYNTCHHGWPGPGHYRPRPIWGPWRRWGQDVAGCHGCLGDALIFEVKTWSGFETTRQFWRVYRQQELKARIRTAVGMGLKDLKVWNKLSLLVQFLVRQKLRVRGHAEKLRGPNWALRSERKRCGERDESSIRRSSFYNPQQCDRCHPDVDGCRWGWSGNYAWKGFSDAMESHFGCRGDVGVMAQIDSNHAFTDSQRGLHQLWHAMTWWHSKACLLPTAIKTC